MRLTMKKKLYFLVIFIQFITPAFAQKQKTDWKENDLKGKVKSVKTSPMLRTKEGDKLGKWKPWISYSITFDENGNSVERSDFKEDGSLNYHTEYKRDADSKLTETIVTWADEKPAGKTVCTYDTNGYLSEEIKYKSDGSVSSKYIYVNDKNGNWIESQTEKPGEKTMKTNKSYKYDSNGNLIQIKWNHGEDIWVISDYTYDEKGNRIKWIDTGADGVLSTITSRFDDKGNETDQFHTSSTKLYDHINWTYEFDKQGNWIKKSTSIDGAVPTWIEERMIIYY